MISEPSGLPNHSFHRQNKASSDEDNISKKVQNDIINNNEKTAITSSKNDKENSQEAKSLQSEISSTTKILFNESEQNTNKPQKELENDENIDQNINKMANVLRFGFNIDSEATFISQSDYYKEDSNKKGFNIIENDEEEEEKDVIKYEEEEEHIETKNEDDFEENNKESIKEEEIEDDDIKDDIECICEEEENKENDEEKNIFDADFIENEEDENDDKSTSHNSSYDNTEGKNLRLKENNEDKIEDKEESSDNEKETFNEEKNIEEEKNEEKTFNEFDTKDNFSESPSTTSNSHNIFHNKFSITSTVLVDNEPAKNFQLMQNTDMIKKEKVITPIKEDKEEIFIKIEGEKSSDKEFFHSDINEKDETNNTKIHQKALNEAETTNKKSPQPNKNGSEPNNDKYVFQTSSNGIDEKQCQISINKNKEVDNTKVFQTSSNEAEKIDDKQHQINKNEDINYNNNQNNNDDQKTSIYKTIAEEAINGNNYSRITSSNYEEVISNVRSIQKSALNEGDYELAERSQKAVNGVIRHVNNLRFLQFSEAKTVEMNEQLKATQNDLNDLKDKWKKVMSNARMKMNEELENLRNENEREINNFDKKMKKSIKSIKNKNENDEILDKDKIPIEYRKVSPEILQMRSRQKAMIASKRYREAQIIKEEADKLEKIEIEKNYERYVKKMQLKRNELIKKQENKVLVRKQNWEKNLQDIKRVSSLEISHAQKCANQLEKKIESTEEFNSTIRSPRKTKLESKNEDSNNVVNFKGNQRIVKTAAVAKISEKAELSPRIVRNKKGKRERAALQFRQRALINKVAYSNLIVQPKVKKTRSPR